MKSKEIIVQDIKEEMRPGYKLTKAGWIPEGWTYDTIGKSLKIVNSKRKPISEDIRKTMQGEYPYYGPTRIQDYIDEYHYEGEFALIAEDGDHFLKYREVAMTQFANGKFNVNNHAHAIKGTEKCETKWFYWYYNRRSVFSHLTRQGAGRYKLNKGSLELLPIAYPIKEEQKRIIKILDTWLFSINTLKNLISQKQQKKKALMQQLLTGKKRFPAFTKATAGKPGFDGEWKEVHLKDLFKRITRKNTEKNTNVVTISAQRGLVLQDTYFKKNIASEITDNYFLLQKDEFAYNKSYSNGYPMGAIKRLKVLDKAVVTTLYICFDAIDPTQTSRDFFEHFFEEGHLNRGLKKVANEGGRAHGLLNVTPKDFFNLQLKAPEYDEQEKIAEVLNAASKEIELLNQKLDALKDQKKGLMQQLLTGKKRLKLTET